MQPGTISVSVLYFVFAASCIGGPAVVDKLGPRWSLFTAFLCLFAFCLANLVAIHFPPSDDAATNKHNNTIKYAALVPTAALVGIAASFLWTAQGSYLTTAAERYALASNKPSKSALGLFNGVFWGFFQLTQITGNLLEPVIHKLTDSNTDVFLVYSVFGLIGALLILFLPTLAKEIPGSADPEAGDVDEDKEDDKPLMEKFREVWSLWGDHRMQILIPVILLSGFEQGFMWNDFTTHYVKPVMWRYGHSTDLGYIMAIFGAADAGASLLMGKLSDVIGRIPVLTIGTACQATVIAMFIIHGAPPALPHPLPDTVPPGAADVVPAFYSWAGHWGVLSFAAVLWGIGDAVWNTQLSAILGDWLSEVKGPAFANFKLWQSLSIAACFLYNDSLPTRTRQFIVVVSLVVGYSCSLLAARKAKKANELSAELSNYALKAEPRT